MLASFLDDGEGPSAYGDDLGVWAQSGEVVVLFNISVMEGLVVDAKFDQIVGDEVGEVFGCIVVVGDYPNIVA